MRPDWINHMLLLQKPIKRALFTSLCGMFEKFYFEKRSCCKDSDKPKIDLCIPNEVNQIRDNTPALSIAQGPPLTTNTDKS